MMFNNMQIDFSKLAEQIKTWGVELGFDQIGITNTQLAEYEQHFQEWLARGYHGEMDYMERHGTKRTRPEELVPGTTTIITARLNYLPPDTEMVKALQQSDQAYISRYATGGDYHKFIRKRLQKLAARITAEVGEFGYRAFTDSAPVLEKPLAEKAGLGWMGKNTLILNRNAGSWFFLGVLYTDLPLPLDEPTGDLCGKCKACINVCPTGAIVEPYVIDSRLCISYLTIEHKSALPLELRPLMGNRIFGCDDCQLICPWNRYAKPTDQDQFKPRHGLTDISLIELFNWDEATFLQKTEGSAIRRIGHERWLRNIAVALGNAKYSPEIVAALQTKLEHPSELVREHVIWALEQQQNNQEEKPDSKQRKLLLQSKKLNKNY